MGVPQVQAPNVGHLSAVKNFGASIHIDTSAAQEMGKTAMMLLGKSKILITWGQCLSGFATTFTIPWPPGFAAQLDAIYGVFNIDFMLALEDWSCVVPTSFFSAFLVKMAALPFFIMLIYAAFMLAAFLLWAQHEMKVAAGFLKALCLRVFCCRKFPERKAHDELELPRWKARIQIAFIRTQQVFFGIVFLLYPSICSTIFLVFKCEQYGSKSYLSKDLNIESGSPVHNTYSYLAGILMFVYVLG